METFEAVRESVLDMYGKRAYAEALSLLEANIAVFADHRATFSFWEN